MTITKEMTISDILGNFPQKSQKMAQEMTNRGLHCVGCGAATWETLEAGMLSHGMEEGEIEDLVNRLNEILKEEFDPTTIVLTPRAAKKFKSICEEEGKPDTALRFGDQPGGCSGFEYVLDFSDKLGPNDALYHSNGIDIHIDKDNLPRLLGCEIDYLDGLNGAGFKISNPNAKGSCGCGSSQAY
jgi:iron-sulfur cluster assembly protein